MLESFLNVPCQLQVNLHVSEGSCINVGIHNTFELDRHSKNQTLLTFNKDSSSQLTRPVGAHQVFSLSPVVPGALTETHPNTGQEVSRVHILVQDKLAAERSVVGAMSGEVRADIGATAASEWFLIPVDATAWSQSGHVDMPSSRPFFAIQNVQSGLFLGYSSDTGTLLPVPIMKQSQIVAGPQTLDAWNISVDLVVDNKQNDTAARGSSSAFSFAPYSPGSASPNRKVQTESEFKQVHPPYKRILNYWSGVKEDEKKVTRAVPPKSSGENAADTRGISQQPSPTAAPADLSSFTNSGASPNRKQGQKVVVPLPPGTVRLSPNGEKLAQIHDAVVKDRMYLRMRRIFEYYDPSRLSNIDEIARSVAEKVSPGQEDAFIQSLVQKYGPEPPLSAGNGDDVREMERLERIERDVQACRLKRYFEFYGVDMKSHGLSRLLTTYGPLMYQTMWQHLEEKYGPESAVVDEEAETGVHHPDVDLEALQEVVDAAQLKIFENRLRRFYTQYSPHMVNDAEEVARTLYPRREEAIQEALRSFGPEPPIPREDQLEMERIRLIQREMEAVKLAHYFRAHRQPHDPKTIEQFLAVYEDQSWQQMWTDLDDQWTYSQDPANFLPPDLLARKQQIDAAKKVQIEKRLQNFFAVQDPRNSHNMGALSDLAEGREQEAFLILEEKYGKEPELNGELLREVIELERYEKAYNKERLRNFHEHYGIPITDDEMDQMLYRYGRRHPENGGFSGMWRWLIDNHGPESAVYANGQINAERAMNASVFSANDRVLHQRELVVVVEYNPMAEAQEQAGRISEDDEDDDAQELLIFQSTFKKKVVVQPFETAGDVKTAMLKKLNSTHRLQMRHDEYILKILDPETNQYDMIPDHVLLHSYAFFHFQDEGGYTGTSQTVQLLLGKKHLRDKREIEMQELLVNAELNDEFSSTHINNLVKFNKAQQANPNISLGNPESVHSPTGKRRLLPYEVARSVTLVSANTNIL